LPKPNLFRFATSELSQDAFLAWLISWADPAHRAADPALHLAATHFLDHLLALAQAPRPAAYDKVVVKLQQNKIDLLIEVNDDLVVIIEDKTHTEQHSNQLERYREKTAEQYPGRAIAAIYLKTGDQSSYKQIEDLGFRALRRTELLQLLEEGVRLGVANPIFHDFRQHLTELEAAVNAYRTTPLDIEHGRAIWSGAAWTGFYLELQKTLTSAAWGYVPNADGGFHGFWWHGRDAYYLLLKEHQLCFKLNGLGRPVTAEAWHEALAKIQRAAAQCEIPITRPTRRGNGHDVTVAFIKDDYRRPTPDGLIDMDRTIGYLRRVEAVLDLVHTDRI